jgi:hypothetical protein
LHDFTAYRHDVLGSSGRSIILDGAFRDYLVRRDLVQSGQADMAYFFKPRAPDVLSRFGVRWIVAEPGPEPRQKGWVERGRFETWHQGHGRGGRETWRLYENPVRVTPVYIEGEGGRRTFVQTYDLRANEILVTLASDRPPGDLVVAFLAHPGWKAFADGSSIDLHAEDDRMIRLSLGPEVREVRLVYRPYSDVDIWAFVLASPTLAAFCVRRVLYRR